ncbi:hypothetical protein [Thermogemmatispora tikiterensis]|uniref:Uncharacterized protein n=1 Tax=Thermogemmatispora tikiterensis TaxID=1825093 RepID=A0A328VDG4_9CHLR|nr:hypothetical protein [Thermogemmatispora tikiterensis]RAQ94889.1 hypothetical protein A4R35_05025 [Thermogemmatispora tikiterensis]
MDQKWIYGPDDLYGISAYLQLIQQWVATAFPQPRDPEIAARLGSLWASLGWALQGRAVAEEARRLAAKKRTEEFSQEDAEQPGQQLREVTFDEEIKSLATVGRAGDPPVQGLEQRLRALAEAGVRDGFLAVAMREATEFRIARSLPAALDQWRQLADQLVPRSIWFASSYLEMLPNTTVYGPDS